MILPLGENSRLGNKSPQEKVNSYKNTGFFIAQEVAQTIIEKGWGPKQVAEREDKLLTWICQEWE